ncbi:hypothetical protein [uncultured Chitinophaga sp.]|uniref:hypothetical protein n=1 Tax=uncultured Chitinophaga sp. TaxID=339340 RepID=UPI0025EFFE4D|nr:hypothetical protein [uncultured Chitinophaga sp.]
MLKFLLYLFLTWLFYKLVFDFIIPVYRATKHVKRQMNDMQEHVREQYRQQQESSTGYTANPRQQATEQVKKPVNPDDYIEFEETK